MISSIRAFIISANVVIEISFGSRPFSPGILTISLDLVDAGQAEPKRIFTNSACFSRIEQPVFISLSIAFPPKGITAVYRIYPSLKIAKSVVPPPISIKAIPISFSSSLKTALADARGSSVSPFRTIPASFTQRSIFFIEFWLPTTT